MHIAQRSPFSSYLFFSFAFLLSLFMFFSSKSFASKISSSVSTLIRSSTRIRPLPIRAPPPESKSLFQILELKFHQKSKTYSPPSLYAVNYHLIINWTESYDSLYLNLYK